MTPDTVILRRWTGRIRSADEAEYISYIQATGLADYRRTPGNLGAQMLMRSLDGDETEVTTLSWWKSEVHIRAFAGADIQLARYYPDDDRFLVWRPDQVDHFRLVAGVGPDECPMSQTGARPAV